MKQMPDFTMPAMHVLAGRLLKFTSISTTVTVNFHILSRLTYFYFTSATATGDEQFGAILNPLAFALYFETVTGDITKALQ